ncbi:MAG: phosphoadenosine phosphosulfate reductase family protein [Candidatus Woesearchaeota archaeon]|nr:phosphoadenosine phosphosulfate reductase family protein [Candidatus Woesearchaeota archaeon]
MIKNKSKKKIRFQDEFESKVSDTIKRFRLFTKKDRILVACSGGKDSTAVLYILNKLGYNVQALTIDALIGNYTKQNLENLKKFCRQNKIKLHIISFRDEFGNSLCYIRQTLASKGIRLRSCTICGILKRYLINKAAKRLKADYVATGHNLDDEAQSVMMNLLRNNLEVGARIGPKTGVMKKESRKSFVQRVKPLYLCSEKDVKKYSMRMDFPVNYSPCPCRHDAYRNKVRKILDRLEKAGESEKRQGGGSQNIKFNIISSFIDIAPMLKDKYSGGIQRYCRICKEPSKGEECNTCKLLMVLRSKK